jgi:hypothetical protein
VPRVVLDSGAGADLAHHLDVVGRAHAQALGLKELALPLELAEALLELGLDSGHRALHALRTGDVVRGREDVDLGVLGDDLAGERMKGHEALDLVAEHLDAHGVLLVHREHLDRVSAHAEGAALEGDVVAGVLDVDEGTQQLLAIELVPHAQPHHAVDVLLRGAQTVDRRHAGDDDHIAPREQAVGGRVTQSFDLLVDGGVLLDVRIALRDVGLGLVVVVVGDEVLDRVVREQFLELGGQLGRKGLVRCQHQRGPLQLLDEPGGRGALAGAGRSEQHDVLLARRDPAHEICDGLRLVARRLERCLDGERGYLALQVGDGTRHPGTVFGGSDGPSP